MITNTSMIKVFDYRTFSKKLEAINDVTFVKDREKMLKDIKIFDQEEVFQNIYDKTWFMVRFPDILVPSQFIIDKEVSHKW